jgi:hypothetical protein
MGKLVLSPLLFLCTIFILFLKILSPIFKKQGIITPNLGYLMDTLNISITSLCFDQSGGLFPS